MMARRQKTTRVPVALPPMESAPERWLRNIRLSGFTITMLVIVVLAVVVLAPSLKLLIEQQQEIARLSQAVAQKEQSVAELNGQVARWSDPAYVEAQARDRLMYVYPGEYSYLVTNAGKTETADDGTPISDTIQATQVDWVKSVISSFLTAGLSQASSSELVAPVIGDGG